MAAQVEQDHPLLVGILRRERVIDRVSAVGEGGSGGWLDHHDASGSPIWEIVRLVTLAGVVVLSALGYGVIGGEMPTARAERFMPVHVDRDEGALLGWFDDGQGPGLFLADPTGPALLGFVDGRDDRTCPSLRRWMRIVPSDRVSRLVPKVRGAT
jgi:hypothetical protein